MSGIDDILSSCDLLEKRKGNYYLFVLALLLVEGPQEGMFVNFKVNKSPLNEW